MLCLIGLPVIAWAQTAVLPVKKAITKTYKVSKNDALLIDNQYGNVEIKTWEKREVLIYITISSQAKTVQEAKLGSRVHVLSDRNKGTITCQTIIDSVVETRALKKISKMMSTINYLVYVPKDLKLYLKNQFGNIKVGDYVGPLNVNEKFGDFTAGRLQAAGRLSVEQGNINILQLHGGELIARGFGHVIVDNVSDMLSGGFSSGDLVDIKLTKNLGGLVFKSDNIRRMNITGVNSVTAFYRIHAILSKFNNLSGLKLKEINPYPSLNVNKKIDSLTNEAKKKGSTTTGVNKDKILPKKILEDLKMIKKSKNYEGGDADAKCKISIVTSFCILTIND